MHPFEAAELRRFARKVILGPSSNRSAMRRVCRRYQAAWLASYSSLIGLPSFQPPENMDLLDPMNGRTDAETWQALLPVVDKLIEDRPAPQPSALEKRLNWLCSTLDLSAPEQLILKVVVRIALYPALQELAALETGWRSPLSLFRDEIDGAKLGQLIGLPYKDVSRLAHKARPLRMLGLVEDSYKGLLTASETVMRIARLNTTDPRKLQAALMGSNSAPALAWQEFEHLGAERDLVQRLLKAATHGREKGINILLYGPPGTGKTEFARTLAAKLQVTPVFVGEMNDEGDEPSRASRIAAYAILQRIAGRSGRSILVVDEAEDILMGVDEDFAHRRVGSKIFINRLVELAEAPTLWITNNPDRLGAAIIRRMSMVMQFPLPDRSFRRRIVDRLRQRHQLVELGPDEAEALARLSAPPSVIDTAMRMGALIGTQAGPDSRLVATALTQALTRRKVPATADAGPVTFDPGLSQADCDLTTLADQIVTSGKSAFSMCLHGIAGTGKSAYARHLAERLGVEVLHRRASDLLGMYVGQSEEQIARAFEDATRQRAMLIIDEADSLLRDRRQARASWEVSQVNEMLTWMEGHQHPFICTTNLMDSLDPATLRRFLFKVQFLPMSPEQIRVAFQRSFGLDAPESVLGLEPLTPGDFALVSRKAEILGLRDCNSIGRLLCDEIAMKPEGQRTRIGF